MFAMERHGGSLHSRWLTIKRDLVDVRTSDSGGFDLHRCPPYLQPYRENGPRGKIVTVPLSPNKRKRVLANDDSQAVNPPKNI